jgi:hypothetical protein
LRLNLFDPLLDALRNVTRSDEQVFPAFNESPAPVDGLVYIYGFFFSLSWSVTHVLTAVMPH